MLRELARRDLAAKRGLLLLAGRRWEAEELGAEWLLLLVPYGSRLLLLVCQLVGQGDQLLALIDLRAAAAANES